MWKLAVVRATHEELEQAKDRVLEGRRFVTRDAVYSTDYSSLHALFKRVLENVKEEETIRRAYEFSKAYDYGEDVDDVLYLCDLDIVKEIFGDVPKVTAYFSLYGDADYAEIWLTDSTRPYDSDAEFMRVI